MSMGNEYVKVDATALRSGNNLTSSPEEGKEPTNGVFVLWTSDTGFTGTGWHAGTNYSNPESDSPFYGMTSDNIRLAIDNLETGGNLNAVFTSWKDRVPSLSARSAWIGTLPDSCLEEA